MQKEQSFNLILGYIILVIFAVVGVFYCLSQYRALRAIQPHNRHIPPGLVWLQFVPFLGQIWQIFVICFIADSFRTEIETHRDDSLLGIDPETIQHLGERPTLTFGIIFFASWVLLISFNLWFTLNADKGNEYIALNLIPFILLMTSLIFFILYWVRLVRIKQRITRRAR